MRAELLATIVNKAAVGQELTSQKKQKSESGPMSFLQSLVDAQTPKTTGIVIKEITLTKEQLTQIKAKMEQLLKELGISSKDVQHFLNKLQKLDVTTADIPKLIPKGQTDEKPLEFLQELLAGIQEFLGGMGVNLTLTQIQSVLSSVGKGNVSHPNSQIVIQTDGHVVRKQSGQHALKVETKAVEQQKQSTDLQPLISVMKSKVSPKNQMSTQVPDGAKSHLVVNQKGAENTTSTVQTINLSSGPMHKIQQLVIHHSGQAQSVTHQLAQKVQAAIESGQYKQLGDGRLQMTIKLHPKSLGAVHVTLMKTDEGLIATLKAQTANAKDLIQSQLSHLKQSLTANGLTLQKIDIQQTLHQQLNEQQNQNQDGGSSGQQSQDGQGQDRQFEDEANQHAEPAVSFAEWLEEGGLEHEY